MMPPLQDDFIHAVWWE